MTMMAGLIAVFVVSFNMFGNFVTWLKHIMTPLHQLEMIVSVLNHD